MVDASPHSPASPPVAALCPVCGLPPNHDVTRTVRGVVLSDLICPVGHIFFMKWLAA
jgi:hypothetical protein